MAIQSEIHQAEGYVIRRVSGVLSMADIQAVLKSLLNDGEYSPGMNVVWELTPGTVLSIPADGMQNIVKSVAAHVQESGSPNRLALVSSDDLNFGVS